MVLADVLSKSSPASSEDNSGSTEDVEVHAVVVISELVSRKILLPLSERDCKRHELAECQALHRRQKKPSSPKEAVYIKIGASTKVVLKVCKIVIPKSVTPEMLKCIYEGHLGSNNSKGKGHRFVLWSGFNGDIENLL